MIEPLDLLQNALAAKPACEIFNFGNKDHDDCKLADTGMSDSCNMKKKQAVTPASNNFK